MQKLGMIIGQKGVKYGLITRKDEKKAPQAAPGRLAAFGGDSDSDDDNIGAQVARQAARKVADSKVQDMYTAALAEDPNAFEYDSVYHSVQEQKAAPKQQEKLARQPKYIASLLEQAEVRKREQSITYERVLLKERQKEDHMYDNTEKFITSAYRRKLEEDKKWQESQRLKKLEEEQNDVTKLGHMNNFFTNLTKNVAMGGSTAAASHNKPAAAAAAAAGGTSPAKVGKPAAAVQHHEQLQQQQQQPQQADLESQQQHVQEQQPHQPDPARQQEQHQRDSPGRLGHIAAAGAAVTHRGETPAAKLSQQQQQEQQQEQQQPQQQQAAAAVGGKRKNTEDAIAAARERYLARKRQHGTA